MGATVTGVWAADSMRQGMWRLFSIPISLVAASAFAACAGDEDACTVIAVGKNASAVGSVIVTHANDALRDFRIVRVPGRQHKANSVRPVYYDYCAMGYMAEYGGVPYLRYVGKNRGPTYETGQTPNIPVGSIPQASRTYTYYEGTYPIMNEHQVSIGETTCVSKVTPKPSASRLFYSAELARVALERCDNARGAVVLMGDLIENYGFHGTGECLVVADTEEIWVMEMCGYAEDGSGGLWVAKRVPDDEVFVSTNLYRIRQVDTSSGEMMCSKNLFTVCQELGWWKPEEGTLDWLKAVASGESGHPYASLRRVWRLFSLVKPSAGYQPEVSSWLATDYPFSIKPDQKLSVADVMALHRDVYQGTRFDLTAGVAAGPFGDPDRFDLQNGVTVQGAFERPISHFRCNYIDVTQARSWLPDPVGGVMWLGMTQADRNCFMPVHVGVTKMPKQLDHGDFLTMNLDCAWWVSNLVRESVGRRYDMAILDVRAAQEQLEGESLSQAAEAEAKAAQQWEHGSESGCANTLTRFALKRTKSTVDAWRTLWTTLQTKYLMNYQVDAQGNLTKMGYPTQWLEQCGYKDGPVKY